MIKPTTKTLAIVCNQWGDTGKGKFVDYFAAHWADFVVRGNGGANAGHTIVIDEQKHIFHMVPSGILHDDHGVVNVIGRGVAFDPITLVEELKLLDQHSKSYGHLKISHRAKLVLPYHKLADQAHNAAGKTFNIGTTGRGIGPCYTDYIARRGLIVNDLLNPEIFRQKVSQALLAWQPLMNGVALPTVDEIAEQYLALGAKLASFITNTDALIADVKGKKHILLEGAQGLLLSVHHGSYPYVTSSDCSVAGLANGAGLTAGDVDETLCIVKAFYMTRVGEGPFPTELGGNASADWCRTHTKDDEARDYSAATVNDTDEFAQGVAIRRAGGEYGATTGRPRRTGWLDLPVLRYAKQINGPEIILTKIDVLSGCQKIKLATAYRYDGPDYRYGETTIKKGDRLTTALPDSFILDHCQPEYQEFDGWSEDISSITTYDALPAAVREIINFIEKETATQAVIISVGPEREQTIFRSTTSQ